MDQAPLPDAPPQASPSAAEAPAIQSAERVSSALASLRGEVEALQQAMSAQDKRAADLDAREAALREHAAQLTDREFHLAERHKELNAAQDQLKADAGTWREREEAIAQRERSIAQNGAAPQVGTAVSLRRARLKKQRRLLAERAAQLVRAKEMLANKLADTARTRTSLPLAAGAEPLPTGPARSVAPSRSASGSVGMGMLAAAMSLALIAGTSWWAAGQIDQPKFVAKATIGMAEAVDEPGLAESWTSFHEELARDPQLLEYAAERLKRAGYPEYSTPSDVRRLMDESMTIDGGTPGRLNLQLLGPGRQRTQRLLDAYLSVLVSMANDSRERRADQSSTMVMIDAKANDEPVSDRRMPIFAVLAGGLTVVCAGAGFFAAGVVVRVRGSKNKPAVAGDGEEQRWSIG